MGIDSADNVYVMLNVTSDNGASGVQHSQVLKFSKDGVLLLNDYVFQIGPWITSFSPYGRLMVAASGAWTRAPNFTFNSVPWFEINDIGFVTDDVAIAAGRLAGYLWGVLTLNELPLSVFNTIIDQAIAAERFALGIATNEDGLMIVSDGDFPKQNRLSQWTFSGNAIGSINWQHACRPLGPVDMN